MQSNGLSKTTIHQAFISCTLDTIVFLLTDLRIYRNPLHRCKVVVVSFTDITCSVHAYMHTYYHTLSSSTVCYDYSYSAIAGFALLPLFFYATIMQKLVFTTNKQLAIQENLISVCVFFFL